MTDNEIIKDLKKILELMLYEGDLQRADTVRKALDLIKRKQAEIEDLNATIHIIITAQADWANNLIRTSLEAFAERLKEAVIYIPWCEYPPIHREIDNLVKEMVGETE